MPLRSLTHSAAEFYFPAGFQFGRYSSLNSIWIFSARPFSSDNNSFTPSLSCSRRGSAWAFSTPVPRSSRSKIAANSRIRPRTSRKCRSKTPAADNPDAMSLFPSLTDHPPRQACTIDPILPLAKSSPIASNTTPQGGRSPLPTLSRFYRNSPTRRHKAANAGNRPHSTRLTGSHSTDSVSHSGHTPSLRQIPPPCIRLPISEMSKSICFGKSISSSLAQFRFRGVGFRQDV